MNLLDDLLDDSRISRLFSEDARPCALQLWIIQIKVEQSIENHLVYGRLLPYNYANDSWLCSDDDNFRFFGETEAQLIRVSLYIRSNLCAALLRQLVSRRSISEISKDLNLALSDKLEARFGTTALTKSEIIYRPVAYLLNLDAQ
jgi:hypothetical protein